MSIYFLLILKLGINLENVRGTLICNAQNHTQKRKNEKSSSIGSLKTIVTAGT